MCGPRRCLEGGGPGGWGPEWWEVQNFALFSLSRRNFRSVFSHWGSFSWNCVRGPRPWPTQSGVSASLGSFCASPPQPAATAISLTCALSFQCRPRKEILPLGEQVLARRPGANVNQLMQPGVTGLWLVRGHTQ